MKRIMTLVLAAGLVFGAATGASAVDFNAKGQWIFGFGAADAKFMQKDRNGKKKSSDIFQAAQRVRLQIDAVASESLSGTVFFEIGDQRWGEAAKGAALGADGTVVEVRRAYIDWVVPQTDLKFRMGLQGVTLPNVAGGSSIMDDDVAGITASYKFNDNVGLTALWMRPYNDNWTNKDKDGNTISSTNPANFLDNVDLFALMLPVTMDGWKVTPWVMYGAAGKNSLDAMENLGVSAPNAYNGFLPFNYVDNGMGSLRRNKAYSDMFFAGLPIGITALDPFNFELDLNYGSSTGFGRYDTSNQKNGDIVRGDSKREGWLIKGLAEYKMEWMTPGIFAWYGSGDDGNVKNGSERMPSLSACGNFTSFMGDDPKYGWGTRPGTDYDLMLNYAGTWGVGLQLKDITFLEDLKHTFRVAYWGGTNAVGAVKYAYDAQSSFDQVGNNQGFYLTTNDYLIEFNLDSTYQIYENLEMAVMLGYIVNGVDKGTWKRSYQTGINDAPFSKGDGYKAEVFFSYSF